MSENSILAEPGGGSVCQQPSDSVLHEPGTGGSSQLASAPGGIKVWATIVEEGHAVLSSSQLPPEQEASTSKGLDESLAPEPGADQVHPLTPPTGTLWSRFTKKKRLGVGSFGEAWWVKREKDGVDLVAKIVDLKAVSPKDLKYVEGEIQCLSACDHFAIIRHYEDSTEENQYMVIIMEFADAGDLNAQIKSRASDSPPRYFEEHEVAYTFVQIAMALDHVHRRRMLHRDVKGANVLLMSSGLVKLGDFGFSSQYEETVSNGVAVTFCGTPYYMAPEVWRRQKYSKKADVWALGVLLFEIIALKRPFAGQGMRALMDSVMGGKIPEMPGKFSGSMKDIVKAILVADPNKRPSLADLFQMPQMQQMLADFESSVKNSELVSGQDKARIAANIQEIRETNPSAASGTTVGPVGAIQSNITHEGPIRKESQHVWKERYLALRDGSLVISLAKGEKEAKPMPLTQVASVIPISFHAAKQESVFAINTTDYKTMWIQALSPVECNEWIHKIQQAIGVA